MPTSPLPAAEGSSHAAGDARTGGTRRGRCRSVPIAIAAWAIAAALVTASAGCSHSTHDRSAPTKLHEATPPHGGTAVDAGDDYRIEFVHDGDTLTAYILDDEMEEFVRIADRSLELEIADPPGQPRTLTLNAVASTATGETVGNTSQFDGQADWLKTTPAFRGTLKAISIRGSTFRNLPFNVSATHDSR